jgi:hypothetical protein
LESLDEAIEVDHTVADSYRLRGEVRCRLGEIAAAEKDARTAVFLGDPRGYYTLGEIEQVRDDLSAAIGYYLAGMPQLHRFQGWDVAVYGRRGALGLLPQLDAPGPSRYDFASALALIDLYESQGRDADAEDVRNVILWLDPYFDFSSP